MSNRSSVFAILKFPLITRALPVFAVYTVKIVVSVVSFLKVSTLRSVIVFKKLRSKTLLVFIVVV